MILSEIEMQGSMNDLFTVEFYFENVLERGQISGGLIKMTVKVSSFLFLLIDNVIDHRIEVTILTKEFRGIIT